jgi:hypothetical protein
MTKSSWPIQPPACLFSYPADVIDAQVYIIAPDVLLEQALHQLGLGMWNGNSCYGQL